MDKENNIPKKLLTVKIDNDNKRIKLHLHENSLTNALNTEKSCFTIGVIGS